MVLSIAACGSSSTDQKGNEQVDKVDQGQDAANNNDSKEDEGQDGDIVPQSDLSKRVTITLASIQTTEGYDYTSGDDFAKFYSEKFNYDLEVTALNWSNWHERLNIWINSGDMPDVCVYDYKHAEAASYVEQGLLYRLPDDWKNRWPNVAKVFEVTQLGPEMEKRFDGTYFLPRARFYKNLINDPDEPVPNHFSLYMRKDWAEAVDFPIKSTYKISEVLEFAKKIKESDPGNLGDKLIPIAQAPSNAVRLFVGSNSTYYNGFYKDKDGTYKWGATSQETLEGLKMYAEAYQSGLLDPEFYTLQQNDDTRQFDTQGIAACNFGEAPTAALPRVFITNFQGNVGLDPFESINVATVLGEDGYFHQQDLINYWGTIIFSPNIEEEKFERWMDVLEFNASQDGSIFASMGLKDVDWEYDSEGNIVSLHDITKQPLGGPDGKYPSMGYTLGVIILHDDFAFDNPNNDEKLRELSRVLYTERCEIATPDTFTKVDWDLFCFDSPNMRKVQFDYDTELTNLITMGGDIEQNWKDWIESKMPMIQPVLDELNSTLN